MAKISKMTKKKLLLFSYQTASCVSTRVTMKPHNIPGNLPAYLKKLVHNEAAQVATYGCLPLKHLFVGLKIWHPKLQKVTWILEWYIFNPEMLPLMVRRWSTTPESKVNSLFKFPVNGKPDCMYLICPSCTLLTLHCLAKTLVRQNCCLGCWDQSHC